MELTSSAFKEGAAIPSVYSCDGKNISPPLAWDSVPPATRSLALICDDPDAPNGVFTHWVIYNLPPRTRALPEGVPMGQKTYAQATQAGNDFGNTGYGGPCPPGGTHRYLFQLYALDVAPAPVASKEQLLKAMEGHIVGHAQLMGRYTR